MDYRIKKSQLKGNITLPSSKSYSHRYLIEAMLSKKDNVLKNINMCDDIYATINVMKGLGAKVEINHDEIYVDSSMIHFKPETCMDVYASGSTLRFFIPICLTQKGTYLFKMRDRLKERSLKVYEGLFKDCIFERKDDVLKISGQIHFGKYEVDGSHSSQFLSGLIMALPLLDGDSEIIIKEPFVSKDYFYMTLSCLKKAGIEIIEKAPLHYYVKGHQKYNYQFETIEFDASSQVFAQVANALGQQITWQESAISFQSDNKLKDFLSQESHRFDVEDCPDLVPGLALALSLKEGEFEVFNAKRLIDKESNRLLAVKNVLNILGANVLMKEDGLVITGVPSLKGGCVDSYHDHRIAMMAVIAGFICEEDVILKNGECVSKSWPSFYDDMRLLGGVVDEL